MSQLSHRPVRLVPTRPRTALVGAAVAALFAAIVLAVLVTASDGESTSSQVKPGDAPALRSDGGPEESTRGPFSRSQSTSGGATRRPDGGPEESTRLR